jgi:hypothetical protein
MGALISVRTGQLGFGGGFGWFESLPDVFCSDPTV